MENFNKFILNKTHLLQNVSSIKKQLKEGVLFCACVKANAYGLGLAQVCKILEHQADYFAVASVKEATLVRNTCPRSKILILGKTSKQNYTLCAQNNFDISISCLEDLKNIKLEKPLNIHICLNTGMNRFGFSNYSDIEKALKIISKNKNLNLAGAFSHFATGLENETNCAKQYAQFCEFKSLLPKNIIYSIASSGTSNYLNFQENMVRVGFNIYVGNNCPISVESEIVHTFKVQKCEAIGYNCAFIAPKDMLVGVVPLGYADGVYRGLSNCGKVIINDKLAPIIGLICMDCLMVCLDNTGAKIGTKVTILGQTKKQKISVLDWAKITKESPYALLTNLNYKRCEYIVKE